MKRYRSPGSSAGNAKRLKVIGVAGAAVVLVGVGLGVAAASEEPATVNCQTVADKLPAVPAQAQAEVERNLALLNTQIQEANARIISTEGQGGANFVQNAILGPLEDKRFATINRIETAIGRNAAKPDLNAEELAPCSLNENGGGNAAPEPTAVETGDEDDADNAGGATGAATVNCPDVVINVDIPAQAQAEVDRNLELLQTQIDEANARIISTEGQGGANFVQNAILGPLEDKRFATINRIETAIGRNADKPDLNAEGLAPCTLNEAGDDAAEEAGDDAEATPAPTESAAAGDDAAEEGDDNAAGAKTVNCPDVNINVTIPAQAQAEVDRNLELLQTQIDEANARIISTEGQGGANFIQNAILGPLEDKRFATINRIETAIGRNADKPDLNAEGLAPCSLNE
ncbi:hypothetical protein [Actinoplanes sp. NBRC 101535]|uniref:hypothetical protein n=1 Tax=Actinoplanes sp. NBRC 101535 TaxID=3032196 RepID=UPI002555CB13|nr:hypothetical protein [Actinoplanes sp. NBRC 101535]